MRENEVIEENQHKTSARDYQEEKAINQVFDRLTHNDCVISQGLSYELLIGELAWQQGSIDKEIFNSASPLHCPRNWSPVSCKDGAVNIVPSQQNRPLDDLIFDPGGSTKIAMSKDAEGEGGNEMQNQEKEARTDLETLPDGVKLRGDINVLLLGDPSTAKSQFLKFVEKTAPVAVYTSGKGSSAAGLTASVIRDNSSPAANPPSGRYDDLKTAQDNIDLQTTILSRFDLIFIVKDIRMYSQDKSIVSHIIKVHASANATMSDSRSSKEDNWLKRYIHYYRTHCHPAASVLQENYVKIRQDMRRQANETGEAAAIPITVRQLEAVVRLSEALARMRLSYLANENHVSEALRLFNNSTMDAANCQISINPKTLFGSLELCSTSLRTRIV
ncbi:unnamed protein product [Coffea canephora]|uniref:DNA helicase n=1 Tax=Coffea canephora TaxID=49390 RepID=A0A068V9Q8_COFCA|nr:unnamed protein product [Coffea canephora]